jgi:hypothetical protein
MKGQKIQNNAAELHIWLSVGVAQGRNPNSGRGTATFNFDLIFR